MATTDFYKGKKVELLVPFAPGGGTDVTARALAPFFNKHLQGKPSVQVVNVAGGGSITGANTYELNRPHDGLHLIATSGSTHNPYLLGQTGVKYDLKKLTPILTIPQGAVIYVSPSIGYKEPKDLLKPAKPLVYAGVSATGWDVIMLLAWEVLGIEVKTVLGYEGRGPTRVAFEQGESNIDFQLASAYKAQVEPLVAAKKAIPIATQGMMKGGQLVRDPAFPELPTIRELHISMYGKEPSGPAWEAYKAFVGSNVTIAKPLWVHSDAPPEAIANLRAAAYALSVDPEFYEKAREALGGYGVFVGEDLEKTVRDIMAVPESVLEWVRKFLRDKYGVKSL